MSAEGEGLSKSARKRANKKAREAEEAAEPEPPAPAPKAKAPAAPKAEGKAKAKAKAEAPAPEPEPKAKAKGKAKAEPKAAAAPEPAPKAESKAKAKAKGEAKAAPAPAAPEAKAKTKAKAKAKKEEPQAPVVDDEEGRYGWDDGTGGDWEVASAVSKKQQKRKEQLEEKKKKEEEEKKAAEIAAKQAEKAAKAAAKSQAKAKPDAKAKPAAKADAKATPAPAPAVAVVSAAAVDAKEKEEDKKPAEPDPNVTVTVKVPSEKIGRVIGPKGSNIALIKEKTGIKNLDTAVDVVTIIGLPETVGAAEIAIHELIEKGYMSLAFEDFKQDEVAVLPNSIPNIIGERGAIIQVIKKECKVEIDIPPVPKNAPANRKVKVTVAGSAEGVEKAKEVINSIAVHQHHEVTHPGFTHQEMEVEEHKYRFLIGKGGSEMRHIQNNYKVKVNIPREGSVSDKVLVVGEERDVERAVKYIEKILSDADQPRGRDKPEKSDDPWNGEEQEEAWMSPYMYKRR